MKQQSELSSDFSTPLKKTKTTRKRRRRKTNMQLGLDNKQALVRAVEIMSLVGNRITLQKRKD